VVFYLAKRTTDNTDDTDNKKENRILLFLFLFFGLAVGATLAFGVALMQYLEMGRVYFWQIMLPGAVLGIIVGYVTQFVSIKEGDSWKQLIDATWKRKTK
jgi:hypothetical protein